MKREVKTRDVLVDVPEKLLTGLNATQRVRMVERLNRPLEVSARSGYGGVELIETQLIDARDEGLDDWGIRRYRLIYAWTEDSSD